MNELLVIKQIIDECGMFVPMLESIKSSLTHFTPDACSTLNRAGIATCFLIFFSTLYMMLLALNITAYGAMPHKPD